MKLAYLFPELHGGRVDKTQSGFAARAISGHVLTFPAPPDPKTYQFDLSDTMKISTPDRVSQHAINGWMKMAAAVHRINADTRYSPSGRKDMLRQDRIDHVKLCAALDSELKAATKTLGAARNEFFAVPAAAQNDLVTYFRELEMRNHLRTLKPGEAMEWVEKNPSVLLSVLRSPVPDAPLEDFATKLWRQQRENSDPVYAEGLMLTERSIDWSRAILQTTAGVTRRSLMEAEGMTRAEIVAMTNEVGANELFGFNPAEVAAYTHQRAA